MGLKDEITAYPVYRRRSNVDLIAEALDDKDRSELLEVLADRQIPSTAIGKALRARGFEISDSAIVQWRQRHVAS